MLLREKATGIGTQFLCKRRYSFFNVKRSVELFEKVMKNLSANSKLYVIIMIMMKLFSAILI